MSKTFDQLPAATGFTGGETFPLNQAGHTVKGTLAQVGEYALGTPAERAASGERRRVRGYSVGAQPEPYVLEAAAALLAQGWPLWAIEWEWLGELQDTANMSGPVSVVLSISASDLVGLLAADAVQLATAVGGAELMSADAVASDSMSLATALPEAALIGVLAAQGTSVPVSLFLAELVGSLGADTLETANSLSPSELTGTLESGAISAQVLFSAAGLDPLGALPADPISATVVLDASDLVGTLQSDSASVPVGITTADLQSISPLAVDQVSVDTLLTPFALTGILAALSLDSATALGSADLLGVVSADSLEAPVYLTDADLVAPLDADGLAANTTLADAQLTGSALPLNANNMRVYTYVTAANFPVYDTTDFAADLGSWIAGFGGGVVSWDAAQGNLAPGSVCLQTFIPDEQGGSAYSAFIYRTSVPIVAGENLTLYAKCTLGNAYTRLRVTVGGINTDFSVPVDGAWHPLTVSISTTSTYSVYLEARCDELHGHNAVFYLDDVSIRTA